MLHMKQEISKGPCDLHGPHIHNTKLTANLSIQLTGSVTIPDTKVPTRKKKKNDEWNLLWKSWFFGGSTRQGF